MMDWKRIEREADPLCLRAQWYAEHMRVECYGHRYHHKPCPVTCKDYETCRGVRPPVEVG